MNERKNGLCSFQYTSLRHILIHLYRRVPNMSETGPRPAGCHSPLGEKYKEGDNHETMNETQIGL